MSASLLAAAAAAKSAPPPPPPAPGQPAPRPPPAMLDVRHVFDLLIRRLRDMSDAVQAAALKSLTTVWYAAPEPAQSPIAAAKLSLPQQQVLAKHAPKFAAAMHAYQQQVAAAAEDEDADADGDQSVSLSATLYLLSMLFPSLPPSCVAHRTVPCFC